MRNMFESRSHLRHLLMYIPDWLKGAGWIRTLAGKVPSAINQKVHPLRNIIYYHYESWKSREWNSAFCFFFKCLQGKAEGKRSPLLWRGHVQKQLFELGCFLHRHADIVLVVAVIILTACCFPLKSAIIHSRVDQLWIEGKQSSAYFPWN